MSDDKICNAYERDDREKKERKREEQAEEKENVSLLSRT
jgi:hypothetical protein